ncbi:MAG: sigma-54-dependent transcriptional regulator [Candidatus Zhuqueibacterota bacterium]
MDKNVGVLVIDDEKDFTQLMSEILQRHNYRVAVSNEGLTALDMLDQEDYDVVFLDLIMPEVNGLQVLQKIKEKDTNIPVVILTGDSRKNIVNHALELGAYDFLNKPVDWNRLEFVLKNALRVRQLEQKIDYLEKSLDEKYELGNLVSFSGRMQEVVRQLKRVISSEASVSIFGETGTGKELVARTIHFNSHRKNRPFVVFNCAALPDVAVDAELFGTEFEAGNGSVKRIPGKLEQANGGTVFLDEVSELSKYAQGKLFQILKDRTLSPHGNMNSMTLDVRVFSSTSKKLDAEVKLGNFRKDLYYLINVFPIQMPSLAERVEDIPALVNCFVENFNKKNNMRIIKVAGETIDYLVNYPWPGNVRELENVIERSMLMVDGDTLRPEHLPISIVTHNQNETTGGVAMDMKKAVTFCNQIIPLDEIEEEILRQALKLNNYNMSLTAHKLGIGRTTLYRKLDKYQIKLNR